MLSYEELCRRPAAFPSLTGMTRREFDAPLGRFRRAEADLRASSASTRAGEARRRAAGAGHPCAHGPAGRPLMALTWLRIYPACEALGFPFALHKRNAQLSVRSALGALGSPGGFPFGRPVKGRGEPRSAAAVMAAFPQVRCVIDAKEQRINKPRGGEARKPHYSGKKKAHAAKTQVAVSPRGQVEAVSDSVPGSAHDPTPLAQSGALDRLGEAEGGRWTRDTPGRGSTAPGCR
jgi:hypothetical protein